MAAIKETVFQALARLKDDFVDVGALLERTESGAIGEIVASMDLALRGAYRVAETCRRLLVVHRAPVHVLYDPIETLRAHSGEERIEIDAGLRAHPVPECEGDPEQVRECVRLFRNNIRMGARGSIRTAIAADESGAARVMLQLMGGGGMPATLAFGELHRLDIDAFGERWIAATNGGHAAITDSAAVLYLSGDRSPPGSPEGLEAPLDAVRKLARGLQSWRGAIGLYEPGLAPEAEIAALYRDTVGRCIRLVDLALDGYRVRK